MQGWMENKLFELFGGKENTTCGLKLFTEPLACTREAGSARCTSPHLQTFFLLTKVKKKKQKRKISKHVSGAQAHVCRQRDMLREQERDGAEKRCGTAGVCTRTSRRFPFFFAGTSEISLSGLLFSPQWHDALLSDCQTSSHSINQLRCLQDKPCLLCISPTSQSPSRISSLSAASVSPSFLCALPPSDCHILCLFYFVCGKTRSMHNWTSAGTCSTGLKWKKTC